MSIDIQCGEFCIGHTERLDIIGTFQTSEVDLIIEVTLSDFRQAFSAIDIVLTVFNGQCDLLRSENSVEVKIDLGFLDAES